MTTSASVEENESFMNLLAQDILGSGGKLNADTFQSMAKTGGNAWIRASQRFLAGPGAVIAADLGGDRAGTALATLFQTTSGANTLSAQQFSMWEQLGLLNDDKVHKHGQNYTMDPGAIKGGELAMTDPDIWAKQYLSVALDRVAGEDDKSRKETLEKLVGEASPDKNPDGTEFKTDALSKLGRNRNTIRMLTMLTDPNFLDQQEKDIALWRQGQGVNGRYNTMLNGGIGNASVPQGVEDPAQAAERAKNTPSVTADYAANIGALHTQFDSLMQAIGGPIAQTLIPQIQNLTEMLNKAGAAAAAHPEAVKIMGEVAEGIGALMIVLGGAAFAAGIAGLIALAPEMAAVGAAATALSLAFGALAAIDLSAFTSGLQTIEAALAKLASLLHLHTDDDSKKAAETQVGPDGTVLPVGPNDTFTPHGKTGPHGVVGPPHEDPSHAVEKHLALTGPVPVQIVNPSAESTSSHAYQGRDPRSPQVGTLAYAPPTSPVVLPKPQVDVKNDVVTNVNVAAPSVSVTLDGAAIAASVVSRAGSIIEKETRVSTGVNMHDGQQSY
jgi:hypothetical protein